jgi:hypothetical protein
VVLGKDARLIQTERGVPRAFDERFDFKAPSLEDLYRLDIRISDDDHLIAFLQADGELTRGERILLDLAGIKDPLGIVDLSSITLREVDNNRNPIDQFSDGLVEGVDGIAYPFGHEAKRLLSGASPQHAEAVDFVDTVIDLGLSFVVTNRRDASSLIFDLITDKPTAEHIGNLLASTVGTGKFKALTRAGKFKTFLGGLIHQSYGRTVKTATSAYEMLLDAGIRPNELANDTLLKIGIVALGASEFNYSQERNILTATFQKDQGRRQYEFNIDIPL